MMQRTTRRGLLGKGAAGAAVVVAAATLPATVQAAIQQPTVPNTRQYDAARAYQAGVLHQVADLEEAFEATLSPEQLKAYHKLEAAENALLVAEQNLYVEALGAHFPGLAPAFRAVACLSHGDTPYLTCCEYWKDA